MSLPQLSGRRRRPAGPLLFSLLVSFTDWDGLSQAAFVGVDNYSDLISDPFFLKSVRNILLFGAVAVPLSVAPAIGLAVLLNTKLPGMKVFRAVYFLPAVAGVVGVALIWKQLYNATVGFINYGLLRLFDLIKGGIDDELSIHQTHADGAHWSVERQVRHAQRCRRSTEGEDVGIILLVGREDVAVNLDFGA